MIGSANVDAVQLNATHIGAEDAAGIVTIAADAENYWCIDSIHYGYSEAQTGLETLVVTIDGTTVFTLPIPIPVADKNLQHEMNEVIFPRGLYEKVANQAVVVTLSAGDGFAYVNVTYR